jgi:ABC-type branched-subunit amino acid transport system substrate-binding protein
VKRWLVAIVLLASVAHGRTDPTPDVVEDALAFAVTDRARAIALLEEALASGPASADVNPIMVHAGEQHRLAGDVMSAERRFAEVARRDAKGTWGAAAKLGLVLLEARGKTPDERMLEVLTDTAEKDALATQNADRYLLLAGEAGRRDDANRAASHAKKALTYAKDDPAVHARVSAALAAAAAGADTAVEAVAEGPVDRDRIVALLPLSGRFESVGSSMRDALKFGYGTAPRDLVFVDSGATAASAVAALETAVSDGAIAVVGPLLAEETAPVVEAAERLRVPLLSLSQSYEPGDAQHWALAGMYTREDQIEGLLDYVMGDQGLRTFLVFHPDNAYGIGSSAAFSSAVLDRGGSIKATGTYSATEQYLVPYATTLREAAGRTFVETGGYDAIFVPESANRTPLACAALAYEEFAMGTFTPKREGPLRPLLGLSSWNTSSLVTQGNEYTRNSLFPDVFAATAAAPDDPFVAAYREKTGRTPTAVEAAAVDLGKVLALAARSDADTRARFRDVLLEAVPTDTVTGLGGFDRDSLRMRRRMLILTITRSTIEQVAQVTVGD